MGKPSGGGSKNIFTSSIIGDGSVTTTAWVNLGLIPTGSKIWFGTLQAASPDKSITFDVRTSLATKSAGTDAETQSLASMSVTPKSGNKILDMYKNGRLHIVSVVGTGVERFWIKLTSKGSAGAYLFTLNYTVE
jgi:hypothetical protein